MLDLTPIQEAKQRINRLNTESEFRVIKEHRVIGRALSELLERMIRFEKLTDRLNDVPQRGQERFPGI